MQTRFTTKFLFHFFRNFYPWTKNCGTMVNIKIMGNSTWFYAFFYYQAPIIYLYELDLYLLHHILTCTARSFQIIQTSLTAFPFSQQTYFYAVRWKSLHVIKESWQVLKFVDWFHKIIRKQNLGKTLIQLIHKWKVLKEHRMEVTCTNLCHFRSLTKL